MRQKRRKRSSRQKQKGRIPKDAPRVGKVERPFRTRSGRRLHLALTEERAVGAGRLSKARVKGQSSTREVIERRVHAGNLGPVEEVEGLSQYFDFGFFANREAT